MDLPRYLIWGSFTLYTTRYLITVHHTLPHYCTPYVTSSLYTIRYLITVHHTLPHHCTPYVTSSLYTMQHFITVQTHLHSNSISFFVCFLLPFCCCHHHHHHHLDQLKIFFQNISNLSCDHSLFYLIDSDLFNQKSPSFFPKASITSSSLNLPAGVGLVVGLYWMAFDER